MDRTRYKDGIKLKNSAKAKNKIGLMYKVWIAISFIIIQFIQPVWGEKGLIGILKGMIQVSISATGVISIEDNKYITRRNGWEQLDKLLRSKGYKTHILFRQCEFWMDDGMKKQLKGRNIGEFFILWEGDKI